MLSAGKLYKTQCAHVPPGASGSSAMIASVFADFGTSVHSNGGETFTPSQVYWRGMRWPSLKAALVIANVSDAGLAADGVGEESVAGFGVRVQALPEKRRPSTMIVVLRNVE